jgi:hypothetical protein
MTPTLKEDLRPMSVNEVTRHSFSQAIAMSTPYANFSGASDQARQSGEAMREKQNSAKAYPTTRDIAQACHDASG